AGGARPRVIRDPDARFLLTHARLPPPLPRPLDDLDHPPPLGLRTRARLHNAHRVAGLGPHLVVRRDLLGAEHLLPVQRVREAAHHRDRHGLLHLVLHHDAGADLAPAPHAVFLSRRMVRIRARSRRIVRKRSGFSTASVAERNRSRKRSSVSSTSLRSRSSTESWRRSLALCLG